MFSQDSSKNNYSESRQSVHASNHHTHQNIFNRVPLNTIDVNLYTDEENEFQDSYYPQKGDEEYEDEDEDEDEGEEPVDPEFIANVLEYTKCYDDIKLKKKEMAILRKQMELPKKFILNYYDKNSINHIQVSDGKLIKNVSKKKLALKEEIIKQSIMAKIKDPKITQDIITTINNAREQNTEHSVNLKRTYNKSQV